MWLIFGPALLVLLYGTVESLRGDVSVGGLLVIAGLCLIYGVVLGRTTLNYRRRRRQELRYASGRCVCCNYDLHGLPEARCPECGTTFDSEWTDANEDE